MFAGIKRAKFNNKVDGFKQMVTEICTEEHRSKGLLDEMYFIGLSKADGCSFVTSVGLEEDGSINMNFRKGIVYDVDFNVRYSNTGTIVSYMSDSGQLELLEFDNNNEEQLFSKYIDLFLEKYNN